MAGESELTRLLALRQVSRSSESLSLILSAEVSLSERGIEGVGVLKPACLRPRGGESGLS